MMRQHDMFPPTLHSLSILHCPGLDHTGIKALLHNIADTLTTLELRDLPAVKHGRFNGVLDWCPNLTHLTVALDYIDTRFGHMPPGFSPKQWAEAKPLASLTLVSSGQTSIDPSRAFTPVDLYALIDERFLGRLRYLNVAQSTEWGIENDGAELGALEMLVVDELDRENWVGRRWHYGDVPAMDEVWTYERWKSETGVGRRMRPVVRLLRNR